MSLDVGRNKLYSAWKTLNQRWDATRLSWHDVVREEFAQEFWANLEMPVLSILPAIDRLSQVLIVMKQECED